MYAKAAMNVRKSCRKLKINFIVPPLGRMNTNAKSAEDYIVEALFGRTMSTCFCLCKVFIANKSI